MLDEVEENDDDVVVELLLKLLDLVREPDFWLAESLGESPPMSGGGFGGGLGGGNPSKPAAPPLGEHKMAIIQPVCVQSGLSQA